METAMKTLISALLAAGVAIYGLTGYVAGEQLLTVKERDSVMWRSTMVVFWPVFFVEALSKRATAAPTGVCCKAWQGAV
jgi:hypothetical protein